MANTHPVKNLSGAGFTFEDRVGAWMAAALLAGAEPLGAELGPPTRIDFQVDADGWRLDDLLVTFAAARWCASIKSFPQIKSGAASAEFVARAWEEVLGASGSGFDPNTDLLGMISAPLDPTARGDVHELIRLSNAQAPEDLAARMLEPGYTSDSRRRLWKSFELPATSQPAGGSEPTQGALLGRLQVIEADFEHSPSSSEEQALGWCAHALTDPNDASGLWESLLAVVSETRTAGGLLARPMLGSRLRKRFALRDHPSYRHDWSILREVTERNIEQVLDSLGGELHLDRGAARAAIDDAAKGSPCLALVGPSGSGKTALAKAWATAQGDSEVVWLAPHDLASLAEPGRLAHPLLDVLRNAGAKVWVVLDGLDRSFLDGADTVVAQLARAIDADSTLDLGLVLTSQQQEWSRLVNRLAERNAIVTWKTLPVDTFTDEELTRILDEFPALRGVVLRGRLTGVLRNPKVLDVVLRRLRGGDLAGDEVLRGQESRFAEWFYERLVCGNGPGRAGRGSLAMHLAGLNADTLQPETPLVDLDPAALDHLESLERDGVFEQQDSRVRFAHDLYGDWVRHRLLRVHEHDLPEYVRSRLQSPLWHRAIRLHALEQLAGHDAGGWQAEMQRLGGEQPGVLHDLFLEAPLFAEDATASLEKVWPILVEGEGLLLRRLLTRFQHIATIPNPVVLERMRDLDEDLQTQIATMNRVPYWPLWMSLLQVLHTHRSEVLLLAPDELARTVDMWLRWTPSDWPLRGETADLAVGLGREMLEHKRKGAYGAEDRERRVWSAVLAAVTERREDVVQITDALTGRGAEPADAAEDELAGDLDEDGRTPGDSGRRRPGVDRTFREHCLEGDALHPVIGAEPALAGEILFAILAPRPVCRLRFGMGMPGEELGPERMPGWFFPFYARGPFLTFFTSAPDDALALTLRLVEATTDRWAQTRVPDEGSPTSVEISRADGSTLTLRGDEQVLQWYRGDSRVPMTLASLLMALEKWLYDQADAEHDITPTTERLLGESTSVAIAGLLIGVGCRHPALFKGPLLPLLTAPELYIWDSLYKRHEQSHLLIALFKEPPMVQQLVREWYSLPHRKVPLEGLAQGAMLTDERVAAEVTAARVRWSARIDDQGEPTFLRFLIARMDPANWRERTNTNGSPYWVFEAPEALLKESQQAAQETNRSGFWLTMPMQCRRILSGEVQLPAEELEEFWQAMQSATELPPPGDLTEDGVIGAGDTECGIAAVLVLHHRDWLRQHPDREHWCLDTMLAAAAVRRRRQWFDSSESGTDWSWDAFCADALPGLWAEQPAEPLLRMAIARLAMNIHHATIAKLFAAAAEHRVALGVDFVRLQHLAIHIACFRVAGEVARNRGDEAVAQAAFAAVTAHLESFVDGTLSAEVPAWAELAVPPDRPARVRWAELDTGYVQAAYAWMPPLAEARDAEERAAWIHHWQESVTALVQRITHDIDPRDGEVEGTPDESEYALLNALPARIMQAQPGEARTLWEPILAQARIARYWVESFVGDWFMIGLQDAPAPEAFVREWQAMLQYAQEAWSPDSPGRSYHLSELHWRLLGLDGIAGSRWSAEQAPVIAAMRQWYERWAGSTLQRREDAAHFARFLSRPGAQPLLRDGLAWLAAAETPPRSAGYNDGYEDTVGELLDHVAREHGEIPRSTTGAGDAYRALLQRLADRQVQIALELSSRLSSPLIP
jgi:hypothetical protein